MAERRAADPWRHEPRSRRVGGARTDPGPVCRGRRDQPGRPLCVAAGCRPPPSEPRRPVAGRNVLVLGGTPHEQSATVAELRRRGARAMVVPLPVETEDTDAVARLAGAVVRAAGRVDLVVDFNVAPPFQPKRHDKWRRALAQTVAVLQSVHDEWTAESDARRCGYLAVTVMGGRMGYDRCGVVQPLGGVSGGLRQEPAAGDPRLSGEGRRPRGERARSSGRAGGRRAQGRRLLRGRLAWRHTLHPRLPS